MSEASYDSAVNYFNKNSVCTMDQIRYTYDADQNALIECHDEATDHSEDAQQNGMIAAFAAVGTVGSAIKWAEKEDSTLSQAPYVGVVLCAIFAGLAAKNLWEKRKTIKAVERNVQADKDSVHKPTFQAQPKKTNCQNGRSTCKIP